MKNEGVGPTKATVPIIVLAAVLIYGNMCSVCKDPVMQVQFDFPFKRKAKNPILEKYHYFLFLPFSGCRCPEGQLLQDGHCVPVKDCLCGIPSGNGTLEFLPKEEVSIDCNTWSEQILYFIFMCIFKCSNYLISLY